jgi:hypothetical protein
MTRFASEFLLSMLRRRIEAAGGFATIVCRGAPESGAVLIIERAPDGTLILHEKRPGWAENRPWDPILTRTGTESGELDAYVERRRRADPDLWVVEVDVANAAQLIAEWGAMT